MGILNNQRIKEMSIADTAWVAGIVEGEGSFIISHRPKRNTRQCAVVVTMTDFDVIEALCEKTGLGSLTLQDKGEGRQMQARWMVSARQGVEDLLRAILPYLFERRSLRALQVLTAIAEDREWLELRKAGV